MTFGGQRVKRGDPVFIRDHTAPRPTVKVSGFKGSEMDSEIE